MQLIEEVASDEKIEQVVLWLYLKRKNIPITMMPGTSEDIGRQSNPISEIVLNGTYQFSPKKGIRFDTETIEP